MPSSFVPITAADGDGPFVEPHDVPALERAGRLDRPDHLDARCAKRVALRRRLVLASGLPHRAQHDAAWRDDRRVTRVDRVHRQVILRRKFEKAGAGVAQKRAERVALLHREIGFRRRREVESAPLVRSSRVSEQLPRMADRHAIDPRVFVHGAHLVRARPGSRRGGRDLARHGWIIDAGMVSAQFRR